MSTREDCNRYIGLLHRAKTELQQQKEINAKAEELKIKLDASKNAYDIASMIRSLYQKYILMCLKEEKEYKERRTKFLTDYISDSIAAVFPNRDLVAELVEKTSYGKNNMIVKVIDAAGNHRNPENTEGMFCQQVISLASVVATVHNSKKNKVYLDEAFAMASPDNLSSAASLLYKAAEEGIQLIVIGQHSELYDNIPHREIILLFDELKGQTSVKEIIDKE